jgi:hypothetical protein
MFMPTAVQQPPSEGVCNHGDWRSDAFSCEDRGGKLGLPPEISFGLDETVAFSHREHGVGYRPVPVPQFSSPKSDLEAVTTVADTVHRRIHRQQSVTLEVPAASTTDSLLAQKRMRSRTCDQEAATAGT